MMNKSIACFLVVSAFKTHGAVVMKCAEEDVAFVKKQLSDKRLSAEKIASEEVAGKLINAWSQCLIKNELMMDGLSFRLYQDPERSKNYLRVYNDFDGTSKLFGPFI